MIFEGKKKEVHSHSRKMQRDAEYFWRKYIWSQLFISLVSKGWEAGICAALCLQKPVSNFNLFWKGVKERGVSKVITFLQALWKSVAGKEVQIMPPGGKRWAERCPVSCLVEIMSIHKGTWRKTLDLQEVQDIHRKRDLISSTLHSTCFK